MRPKDRLIVALDVDSEKRAVNLVDELKGCVKLFKVGSELFSSCGPNIINLIKKKGCEVFLDLKFHDIPNTVAKSSASVTRLGVFMFNIHSLGGPEMMRAAALAAKESSENLKIERPKVLAVTILTSMDEKSLRMTGVDDNMKEEALRLARLARDSSLDGVVASTNEARLIRENLGGDFLIVTPGIRPRGSASGDQKRSSTPKEAIEAGSDYIVVGRPIIEAEDPAKAASVILEEMRR
ncbi:MAG: orotidine-5'-phosphate decarboxylase [Candidatus Omnitrophota bacterium]|nr:orotidine-5'-phosphate decarboxylase [Candidatus Omnitrophota bacterium]